jgi:hypothetical protein
VFLERGYQSFPQRTISLALNGAGGRIQELIIQGNKSMLTELANIGRSLNHLSGERRPLGVPTSHHFASSC